MSTRLNPYLNFNGNAREAIQFYHSVFGGELTMSTFAEGGMPHTPADKDKIMHAQLVSPSGYWIMASDTPPGFQFTPGNTMTVSLSGDAEGAVLSVWSVSGAVASEMAVSVTGASQIRTSVIGWPSLGNGSEWLSIGGW